jgi:hypothetical protein
MVLGAKVNMLFESSTSHRSLLRILPLVSFSPFLRTWLETLAAVSFLSDLQATK